MSAWPRMLKRDKAAAYCDLSVAAFEREIVEKYAAKVNQRKLGKAAIVKFAAARKASRLKCNALDSAT